MQEKEQKISPIKQRILQFADSLRISKREFYANIDVSRGTLESKTGITEDVVAKFIAKYPQISPSWLLTGEGSMLKSEIKGGDHFREVTKMIAAQCKDGIPLITIDAMAGFGAGECQVLEYECDRYVVPAFKDAEFLITVKGSSMIPKYNSGDIVACKKLPLDDLFFQWNKVYVLDTMQGALIKRVKEDKDHENSVLIVSDNPSYPPFSLRRDQIHSVAIVVGVIRQE
ncbi:MAG TPA: S24 family peptidase [Paludibacteraceae bacterium]|nr:S24 family peptidase [Paludibacteraceae bacterium]